MEVRINNIEIKNKSWMQVVINKEDGYVNCSLLEDQIGMSLHGFLKLEDIKESIEHIKVLIESEEKYKGESSWDNVKGMYIHPFLALEMVAIKVEENNDYQDKDGKDVSLDRKLKSETEEYYEFLKETVFEFLEINQELKEIYNFIEEFHG
ncbi:MAG: KilA-N domain-containing protein [Brevinemataceae bacterium]